MNPTDVCACGSRFHRECSASTKIAKIRETANAARSTMSAPARDLLDALVADLVGEVIEAARKKAGLPAITRRRGRCGTPAPDDTPATVWCCPICNPDRKGGAS